MEIFMDYILPNVVLFATLYGLAKLVEYLTQEYINYMTEDDNKL